MTNFSATERQGCTEILQSLGLIDVLALTDTLTSKKNSACNKTGAIETILSYSQCTGELLNRRKVKKENIFQYLVNHNVSVLSTLDKQQLINKAVSYWTEQRWTSRIPSLPVALYQPEQVQKTYPDHAMKHELEATKCAAIKDIKEQARITGDQMLYRAQSAPRIELNINMNISQQNQPPSHKEFTDNPDCWALSEQFAQWFFQLLNSQNPISGQTLEEWGPQHFWDDAVLNFSYSTHEEKIEEHRGAEMVSQRLASLVKDERLLFNPNLSTDGLKCMSSPHGLVALVIAGSIHQGPTCIGIFEQAFGLIRNPVGICNWKIKFVKLHIKALSHKQGDTQPCVSLQLDTLRHYLIQLHFSLK